jgi:tetratricopeptide (TPR) repeat protein
VISGSMARRGLGLALTWAACSGAAYEWGGPAARGVRELAAERPAQAALSFEAGRKDLPRSAAVRYDQGLAFRDLEIGDSARAAWRDALSLQGTRGRAAAAYNLGNDAMRAGRFGEAATWYRESLREDWRREDAKRNLEEAIRRLRSRSTALRPPSSGGSGATGPSGSGEGGGSDRRSPPRLGRPPLEERSKSAARSPSAHGAVPSKDEAEHWLRALESERRSQRAKERRRQVEEGGQRDW